MMAGMLVLVMLFTVALGLANGSNYLKGIRKPMVSGAHFLLGATAFELVFLLLRGTPNSDALRAGNYGLYAQVLVAVALVMGLAGGLMGGRKHPQTGVVLAVHAAFGGAAFLLVMAWVLTA
jgi:hypothetical protein